jgi:hypothetical protein
MSRLPALAATGTAAGALSGRSGVGGGSVIVPVWNPEEETA